MLTLIKLMLKGINQLIEKENFELSGMEKCPAGNKTQPSDLGATCVLYGCD